MARDERDEGTERSWTFEWGDRDGGGFVRWALLGAGRCWYWAVLVDAAGELVVVRDHDLAPPRGRTLEVRGDGLWADGICETPGEHWSLGLEAFAVRLDDPADGLGRELGERVAFGLDVEWESGGPGLAFGARGREQGTAHPGAMHGDVLVGRGARVLDAPGVLVERRGPRWSGAAPEATLLDPTGAARRIDAAGIVATPAEGIPRSVELEDAPARMVGSVALRLDRGAAPTALVRALVATEDATGWVDLPVR